ncbi:DUF177 domain-containing protein [Clostridium sp. YIM B02551]|uniref:YceD family protein n=1 Tax=Clostridium sp. YIM B02551 TaxID=2910679 RepID=UPI001EEAADA0|nr:YceD family protein [Clostridium sp. YIM B02551]
MIINLLDLSSKNDKVKNISFEFTHEPFNFEGEIITPLESIKVSGLVKAYGDILELHLDIKTVLEASCSRCLENFSFPIDLTIDEKFTNKSTVEGEELIFIEGDNLDITEVVINDIISTLPIKRLCSESCKGLCLNCGTNLNKSTCNCETYEVDYRLEALKNFFTE